MGGYGYGVWGLKNPMLTFKRNRKADSINYTWNCRTFYKRVQENTDHQMAGLSLYEVVIFVCDNYMVYFPDYNSKFIKTTEIYF